MGEDVYKVLLTNINKPYSECNDQEKLGLVVYSIQSKALRTFVLNVFNDHQTASAFITSPASVIHHHCEHGGLLTHTLEVAEIVSRCSYINDDEREIAVVAALFHDIGKVKVYNEFGRLNTLGKLVNHDALTLEVCASALSQLDTDWPDAAITLRHIWTCASPGARYGNSSATYLTHIIRSADKISVERYMLLQKIKQNDTDFFTGIVWKDDRYYWQPKQEQKSITTRRKRWVF